VYKDNVQSSRQLRILADLPSQVDLRILTANRDGMGIHVTVCQSPSLSVANSRVQAMMTWSPSLSTTLAIFLNGTHHRIVAREEIAAELPYHLSRLASMSGP